MGAKPKNISGSRAASICNLDKFKSCVDTWLEIEEELKPGFCEKNGYEKPVRQDNPFLSWGLAFEDPICEKIHELTGYLVCDREKEFNAHALYGIDPDIATCHIDGALDGDEHAILDENKTTSIWAFRDEYGDDDSDVIPINYSIQVQHNMMLTGCVECWLFVLIFPVVQTELDELVKLSEVDKKKWVDVLAEMGLFKRFVIDVNRDIQYMLKDRYREFWKDNVLAEVPPEPVSMDDLKKLLPRKFGECIAPPEVMHMVNTYRDMTAEEGRVKPIKEDLRVKILDYMRESATPADNKNLRLLSESGRVVATYSKGRFTVRKMKP